MAAKTTIMTTITTTPAPESTSMRTGMGIRMHMGTLTY